MKPDVEPAATLLRQQATEAQRLVDKGSLSAFEVDEQIAEAEAQIARLQRSIPALRESARCWREFAQLRLNEVELIEAAIESLTGDRNWVP